MEDIVYEIDIRILVDYKPDFLPYIKESLAHDFDIPSKLITINLHEYSDYGEIMKFVRMWFKKIREEKEEEAT